ncbi:MAG: nucleotidyltransferase family protein [Solirubrobacteraceae bacterium]
MSTRTDNGYANLRRLGELGREIDRRRGPDPYPRPSGPAPSLQELRGRRDEIERMAARHGALSLRVFGSVARGEARRDSDLDVLVEMEGRRGLLEQAGLQGDLEEMLGCPVHVATTRGLLRARERTREQIEREAMWI